MLVVCHLFSFVVLDPRGNKWKTLGKEESAHTRCDRYIHTYMRTYTYIYRYIIYIHIYIYIYVSIYMYRYIHTTTYMRTYIHTHTLIYTYTMRHDGQSMRARLPRQATKGT